MNAETNKITITDRFIHPDILANEKIVAEARMVTNLLLMNTLGLLSASATFYFSRGLHPAFMLGFIFTASMAFSFIVSIILMRKYARFIFSAVLSIITMTSAIFVANALTGGPTTSPFNIILLLMPLIAFLSLGKKFGVVTVVFILIIQVSMFGIEFLGFEFPLLDLPFPLEVIENWCWILGYLLICQFIFFYEFNSGVLKQQLADKTDLFEHMACHDPLTGLDNRRSFYEKLEKAAFRTKRHQSIFALLYIDLDGFKPINDTYGHPIGDQVLAKISTRLLDNLRKIDTVARLGGDEFGILLEDIHSIDEAKNLCEKVARIIAQSMVVSDLNLSVRSSIGIVIYPSDSADLEELTRLADDAMYKAKAEKPKTAKQKTGCLGQAFLANNHELIIFKS